MGRAMAPRRRRPPPASASLSREEAAALHAGALNMRGGAEDTAGSAAVHLIESKPSLTYVDLRDNEELDATLSARLDACCAARPLLRL